MNNNFNNFSSEEFYKQKLTSFMSEGSTLFDFYSIFSDEEIEEGNKTYSIGWEDDFPSLKRVSTPAEFEDSIEQLDHYFTDSFANDNSDSNSEDLPWLSNRTSSLHTSVKSFGTLPIKNQSSDRKSIQIVNNLPTDSTFSMEISDFNSNSTVESFHSFSKKRNNQKRHTNTNSHTNTYTNTYTNTNTNRNRNRNTNKNTNTNTNTNTNKNKKLELNNKKNQDENKIPKRQQNLNVELVDKNSNTIMTSNPGNLERKGISVLQLQNSFVDFDLNLLEKKDEKNKPNNNTQINTFSKLPNNNVNIQNVTKNNNDNTATTTTTTTTTTATTSNNNINDNDQEQNKNKNIEIEVPINYQLEQEVKPSEILEIFIKKKPTHFNSSLTQENKTKLMQRNLQNSYQYQSPKNKHSVIHLNNRNRNRNLNLNLQNKNGTFQTVTSITTIPRTKTTPPTTHTQKNQSHQKKKPKLKGKGIGEVVDLLRLPDLILKQIIRTFPNSTIIEILIETITETIIETILGTIILTTK